MACACTALIKTFCHLFMQFQRPTFSAAILLQTKKASVTACYEKWPVDEKIIAYKDDCLASGSSTIEKGGQDCQQKGFSSRVRNLDMQCPGVSSWHFEIEVF